MTPLFTNNLSTFAYFIRIQLKTINLRAMNSSSEIIYIIDL